MTDAMERVNDSLDASGSQTEGEDVEEGPSLPDEENPFRIMQKIKKEGILSVVIPKGKSNLKRVLICRGRHQREL